MQGGTPAVLGMPGIDKLGLLTMNYETVSRQVASDDSTDNSKRNCQHKKQFKQKVENMKSKKKTWDAEAQSQHNANNTTESSIVASPMVIVTIAMKTTSL